MLAWKLQKTRAHRGFFCSGACGGGAGRQGIRDYHCDALVAVVLSHPRLRPLSLNEDVVANNGALSVQRQEEMEETEEKRQAEEERKVVNREAGRRGRGGVD